MALKRLIPSEDGLYISHRTPFLPKGQFEEATICQIIDFAYAMSFAKTGEHRDHRSGGIHRRKNGEIFANTFQGKLSEFAVYEKLSAIFPIDSPDLSVYGLGKWDDSDFNINGSKISIKSTKSFGNLLLLETKDWNADAEYIPNLDKGTSIYDIHILVRVDPYCESLMKKNKILYSNKINKALLEEIIKKQIWNYDIPGYITRNELIYAIKNKHIIQQGEMLNGTTKMDADNYYIQTIDLHPIETISKNLL